MYCEDRDLVGTSPEAILARIRHQYRPYDTMPEFDEGFAEYQKSGPRRRDPYDGVKAQAWDRGANAPCSTSAPWLTWTPTRRTSRRPGPAGWPSSSGRGGADMAALSADQMKLLIVETRQRFVELDHEDWNEKTGRYGHTTLEKWAQAARLTAPVEWWEIVRILAQGWDYYGGSDLPGALIGWSSAATSRSAMT
jgi:hypothetical protein